MKLKPSVRYSFSKEDLEFALELAKVGQICLLSSQVCLQSTKNAPILFTDSAGETVCDGLQLPSNWLIEGIYQDDQYISVTFGVRKSGATEITP